LQERMGSNALMGRARRVDVGGMVYHAWNRANFRSRLFASAAQYRAFLGIMEESLNLVPMRILAYCLMPNLWHLVLYPRADGDLARFLQRVTMTHTQRYHAKGQTMGYGHVYQGRYKSLLVEGDRHFLTLVRYVERNAKRAGLVQRAEEWPWSSVYVRHYGTEQQRKMLSPWPLPEPTGYLRWLNSRKARRKLRESAKRSGGADRMDRRDGCQKPSGNSGWKSSRALAVAPNKVPRSPL